MQCFAQSEENVNKITQNRVLCVEPIQNIPPPLKVGTSQRTLCCGMVCGDYRCIHPLRIPSCLFMCCNMFRDCAVLCHRRLMFIMLLSLKKTSFLSFFSCLFAPENPNKTSIDTTKRYLAQDLAWAMFGQKYSSRYVPTEAQPLFAGIMKMG